jgi:hypothetical protein
LLAHQTFDGGVGAFTLLDVAIGVVLRHLKTCRRSTPQASTSPCDTRG